MSLSLAVVYKRRGGGGGYTGKMGALEMRGRSIRTPPSLSASSNRKSAWNHFIELLSAPHSTVLRIGPHFHLDNITTVKNCTPVEYVRVPNVSHPALDVHLFLIQKYCWKHNGSADIKSDTVPIAFRYILTTSRSCGYRSVSILSHEDEFLITDKVLLQGNL